MPNRKQDKTETESESGTEEEEEEEEEEGGGEKFHVEVIKKARVNDDAEWEYLVKWAGYGSESDSWEPQENVRECTRLLSSFWEEVGMDNDDYQIGYEVAPSAAWIKKERRFFHNNFGKDLQNEEKPSSSTVKAAPVKTAPGKAVKTKSKPKRPGWAYVTDSESEEERPRPKKSKKRPVRSSSSSGSESDEPLRKVARKAHTSEGPSRSAAQDKGKGKAIPEQHRASSAASSKGAANDPASLFSAPPSPDFAASKKPLPSASASHTSRPIPRKDSVAKPPERAVSASSPSIPAAPAPAATASTPITSKPAAHPLWAPKPAPPPVPKPAVTSHKDRVPKVKAIDIPMTAARNAISTKARIASGSLGNKPKLTLETADVLQSQQRAALKGLSFKKKHSAAPAPSPASSTATTDPRKRPLFLPDSDIVESPVATSARNDSAQSPSVATAGWGRNADEGWGASTSGGWGSATASGSKNADGGRGADTGGGGSTNVGGGWGESSDSGWGNNESAWGASPARPAEQPATPTVPSQRPAATNIPKLPRRAAPPLPRRTASGQVHPPTPQESNAVSEQAVNQFLASAMPPELAAPMQETDGTESVVTPPTAPKAPRAPAAKKSLLDQLNEGWTWNAELYIEKSSGAAERICDICMSGATSTVSNSLRFSILYRPEHSVLRWEKFHDVSDIPVLVRACGEVSQFCKLTHKADADANNLLALRKYMVRNQQFTYSHVYIDREPVGLLIVYPSSMTSICSFFHAPPEIMEKGSWFVAMLVPWAVNFSDYKDNCWYPTRRELFRQGGSLDPALKEKLKAAPRPSSSALFALGLRILRFTVPTYEFLIRSPRDYCLWHAKGDGTIERPGFETQALLAVLKACRARDVGYKQDVRAIFVHVGALKTLSSVGALGMRRNKRPDLRFYTYGTHETVSPDRWGLREIYPIGGVMTFTALALAQDPWGVYAKIKQTYEHPLWASFIHPCVVAAAASIVHRDNDLLGLLDRGEFFFSDLLELIEDGKISLMTAPPANRYAPSDGWSKVNARTEWALWLGSLSSLDTKGILSECLRQFDKHFGKVPAKDLPNAVEHMISRDFCQLQYQPCIMDNYRRFVLITENRNHSMEERDGIELTTLSSFQFKDEYFPRA